MAGRASLLATDATMSEGECYSMPVTGSQAQRPEVKILLADDSTLLRSALANLLNTEGGLRVVAQAANGEEAVERALETSPDLVIMDVRMPVCDGIEATRRIKGCLSGTRIIMLTVSDEDGDLFEALKAGAEGYLLKNVDTEELVTTI
ncbi:MAG: response regulator transcription factor [Chloroflexi bacterium]|nr:response regulator transcription factor [Chloroflexota bacterium]